MEHNLGHLPLELIESILTHISSRRDLRQCILINKRFYTGAIRKLWHTPWSIHSYGPNHINLNGILTSMDYSRQQPQPHLNNVPLVHHIRRLRFSQNDSIQDILKLLEHAPFVETLRLSHQTGENDTEQLGPQTLSDEDMAQLAQFCPRLKTLSLKSIEITDTAMIALAHFCPHLCHLELHNCHLLTSATLIALKDCPLKHITLNGCKLLENDDMIQPLLQFRTLKELTLCRLSFKVVDGLIRQATTAKVWSRLETILLICCGYRNSPWDDHALPLFFQAHTRLKCVNLNGTYVGDLSILAIATSLPRLWQLNLGHNGTISAHAVRQVAKNCPQLEMIGLMGCGFTRNDFPETGDADADADDYLFALRKDTLQRTRLGLALGQESTTLEDNILH